MIRERITAPVWVRPFVELPPDLAPRQAGVVLRSRRQALVVLHLKDGVAAPLLADLSIDFLPDLGPSVNHVPATVRTVAEDLHLIPEDGQRQRRRTALISRGTESLKIVDHQQVPSVAHAFGREQRLHQVPIRGDGDLLGDAVLA